MIGPDLPPHLRKREASAEKTADSEGSDADFGPAAPPRRTPAADVVATKGSDKVEDDDDDDEDYGPAPPPGPRSKDAPSHAQPAAGGSDEQEPGSDDDDDEVYGPKAPGTQDSVGPLNEAAHWDQLRAEDEVLARTRRASDVAEDGRKRARDEWMLIPPEAKASGSGTKFRASAVPATDMTWAKTPGSGMPAAASRAKLRAPTGKDRSQETEPDAETERNIQAFDELRRHQR